jgi:hypothetical protein
MLDFIRTLTAPFTDSEAQASVLGMPAYRIPVDRSRKD